MKRIISLLMVTTLLLANCNNNKPKETTNITTPDEKDKGTIDPKQNSIADIEKRKEELGKLTPLTADQLKALIPETLMGAKRVTLVVNSANGAKEASADYEITDSTLITLSVFDCSGPAGAGIYGLHFAGLMNELDENDEEYLKAIDFNGSKAFEHFDKTTNDCTFTYFSGGRFLVSLAGEGIGNEILKQAAGRLNLK